MTSLLFLHLIGFVLWIGGGSASMVIGLGTKGEPRASQALVTRVQWAVMRLVVMPGALLTVFSGLMLTFRLMHSGRMGSPWMVTMQALGIFGALLTLFVSVPAAARVAHLDPMGEHAAYFDRMRARLRLTGAVGGMMGLIALLAGALYHYGG